MLAPSSETPSAARRPAVLIPRSADRAGAWVTACTEAGLEPVLVPLIDFERGEDHSALSCLPERLSRAAGRGPALLTVTSITTLRAFAEAGALDGLRAACCSDGVTLAAVGRASGDALRSEGFTPDVEPEEAMNAEGLLAQLVDAAPGTAFLPQSDLAAPTLAEGLESLGWTVVVLQAYRTVDAPADPSRRITATLSGSQQACDVRARVLTPVEARLQRWDAVLGMSPSSARRIVEVLGELPEDRPVPPFVAIGPSTAAEARSLGLSVAEVASRPTPEETAAALVRAVEHAAEAPRDSEQTSRRSAPTSRLPTDFTTLH